MGIDYFTLGLQHPFLAPHHLLLLLGLGIYIGFTTSHISKPRFNKTLFWPVLIGLLLGLIATQLQQLIQQLKWDTHIVLLSIALVSGLLIALRFKLPDIILILIALCGAFIVGFDSAPLRIPGISDWKIMQSLVGTWLSASSVYMASVLLAYLLRNVIDGIIIRVLGSWIAAASSLVLALLVAGHMNIVK